MGNMVSTFHGVLGRGALKSVTGNLVPVWNPHMPTGAPKLPEPHKPAKAVTTEAGLPRKVVYLPSCVTRMMGPVKGEESIGGVPDAMMSILKKANYEVVYPEGLKSQCCGMIFNSRGFKSTASSKGSELEEALMKAAAWRAIAACVSLSSRAARCPTSTCLRGAPTVTP